MELLPEAIRKQLPPLYSRHQEKDPLLLCKFFYPGFPSRWYAIEFDGQNTFFGWIDDDYYELFDFFTLTELQVGCEVIGYPIQRDVTFQPCRLSQVKAAGRHS